MSILRKLIACFLVIYITIIATVVIPVKQAEAVVPAVALTPQAMYVIGALATGAGITFLNSDAAQVWTAKAWEEISDAAKQSIANMATVGNTIIHYGGTLWDELKSLVSGSTAIQDGLYETTVSAGSTSVNDIGGTTDIKVYTFDGLYKDITISGLTMEAANSGIELRGVYPDSSGLTPISISMVLAQYVGGERWYKLRIKSGTFTIFETEPSPDATFEFNDLTLRFVVLGKTLQCFINNSLVCTREFNQPFSFSAMQYAKASAVVVPAATVSGTIAEGSTVIRNNDPKDRKGWQYTIPPIVAGVSTALLLDQLLNKDLDDIASNSEVYNPPEGVTEGDATGWLSNIYTGIQSMIGTVSSGIQSILNALGTIVDTITDGLVGDMANIQIHKLQGIGSVVTTKFPFSLPWDVKYLLENLNYTDEIPTWEIGIPNPITGGVAMVGFTIPEQFRFIVNGIRTGIVIIFVAGLIYATRKLLGGAT